MNFSYKTVTTSMFSTLYLIDLDAEIPGKTIVATDENLAFRPKNTILLD